MVKLTVLDLNTTNTEVNRPLARGFVVLKHGVNLPDPRALVTDPKDPRYGLRCTQHRLHDIDREQGTAVCAWCGSVDIVGKARPMCGPEHRRRDKADKKRKAPNGHNEGTRADREQAIVVQGGRCLICLKPIDTHTAQWDHDHKTGAFRGYLCGRCNTGLGQFQDNTEYLERAIDYLHGKAMN